MEVFYLISFFMIGAVLGSFYNVLGIRIVKHESIVMPRSHCDKCGHVLKWYELIPIFSFIFLGGKCHNCKNIAMCGGCRAVAYELTGDCMGEDVQCWM